MLHHCLRKYAKWPTPIIPVFICDGMTPTAKPSYLLDPLYGHTYSLCIHSIAAVVSGDIFLNIAVLAVVITL